MKCKNIFFLNTVPLTLEKDKKKLEMPVKYHHLYNPNMLGRAYELANAESIEIYEYSESAVLARVKGSRLYDVNIILENEEVSSVSCTCPYPSDYCKHSAAVLLLVDELYLKDMQSKMKQ